MPIGIGECRPDCGMGLPNANCECRMPIGTGECRLGVPIADWTGECRLGVPIADWECRVPIGCAECRLGVPSAEWEIGECRLRSANADWECRVPSGSAECRLGVPNAADWAPSRIHHPSIHSTIDNRTRHSDTLNLHSSINKSAFGTRHSPITRPASAVGAPQGRTFPPRTA